MNDVNIVFEEGNLVQLKTGLLFDDQIECPILSIIIYKNLSNQTLKKKKKNQLSKNLRTLKQNE